MAFVQIAHGRHKCHFSGSFAPLAQFFNRMNDLHGLKILYIFRRFTNGNHAPIIRFIHQKAV